MDKITITRVEARTKGPSRIVGELELANGGPQDVFVGSVGVNAPGLRDFAGRSLEKLTTAVFVPAGGSVEVPFRIPLARTTKSGAYDTSFFVEGSTVRREITVAASPIPARSLRVNPQSVWLEGNPKATIRQRVRLTNNGAAAIVIRKTHGVILHETLGLCSAIQNACRTSPDRGWQAFLDTLVESYCATRVDLLRVQVLGAPLQLAPGMTSEAEIDFHLSGDLKPGRSYQGVLDLKGGGILALEIDCVGASSTITAPPVKKSTGRKDKK